MIKITQNQNKKTEKKDLLTLTKIYFKIETLLYYKQKKFGKMSEEVNKEKNNENVWQRIDIQGTPFCIWKSNKGECRIGCGNNLMTEKRFINENAARKYIFKKPWELILNTMALMTTNIFNNIKNTEK